jgi:hypothetical protein
VARRHSPAGRGGGTIKAQASGLSPVTWAFVLEQVGADGFEPPTSAL